MSRITRAPQEYIPRPNTTEGQYSYSHRAEADQIAEIIWHHLKKPEKNTIRYADICAGHGGVFFGLNERFGEKGVAVEINNEEYKGLVSNSKKNNVPVERLINQGADVFLSHLSQELDFIFFDPPWGGPDYKNKKTVPMVMYTEGLREGPREEGNDTVSFLVWLCQVMKQVQTKMWVIKAPINWDVGEWKEVCQGMKLHQYNIRKWNDNSRVSYVLHIATKN